MANVLDFVEPGPLLSDEVVKPPIVSKATVQRCISKLSPHWTDEQLDQVGEMFQSHGLLRLQFFLSCADAVYHSLFPTKANARKPKASPVSS